MGEFLELLPPPQALDLLLEQVAPGIRIEYVDTASALGRITALPVTARQPLPAFPRSTVDGFAVRAADTYGASDSLPAYLSVIGEAPMGRATEFTLNKGQAVLIHTGGMLPAQADAVVMVEHTQQARPEEIEVLRPAAVGENVLKVGEDVSAGEVVIPAGTRLRPAEIGGLMALGETRLQVAARPVVGILSSGDEVIPPEDEPLPGQVRDINAYTLSALVEAAGGVPARHGIVADRFEALETAARQALQGSDMLVITAGSSASARDLTAQVINRLGQPGVLVHGVNVRPGKPTILAVCDGKPVIGLPGNPVSALVIASLFVRPAIARLAGLRRDTPAPSITARLTVNLPSQAGREDWVTVRLTPDPSRHGEYLAEPIFARSNLIFSLSRADGLAHIPADATGISAGEVVHVTFL